MFPFYLRPTIFSTSICTTSHPANHKSTVAPNVCFSIVADSVIKLFKFYMLSVRRPCNSFLYFPFPLGLCVHVVVVMCAFFSLVDWLLLLLPLYRLLLSLQHYLHLLVELYIETNENYRKIIIVKWKVK